MLYEVITGVKKPEFMQGRSFKPVLEQKTPADWRQSVYYRYWIVITSYSIHYTKLYDCQAVPTPNCPINEYRINKIR